MSRPGRASPISVGDVDWVNYKDLSHVVVHATGANQQRKWAQRSQFNVIEEKGEYDLVLFLPFVFFSKKCAAVFRATWSGRQKDGNDDGDNLCRG